MQRRLRRHGVTGRERFVLYDCRRLRRAAASQQAALAAGHPQVSVPAGGSRAWLGERSWGRSSCRRPRRCSSRGSTPADLRGAAQRLGETATILDVRSEDESWGRGGYPCDPRQGHIRGARHLEVERLFSGPGCRARRGGSSSSPGCRRVRRSSRNRHSGSRSTLAALALRSPAMTRAITRSWHEWSRHEELRQSAERDLREEGPAQAEGLLVLLGLRLEDLELVARDRGDALFATRNRSLRARARCTPWCSSRTSSGRRSRTLRSAGRSKYLPLAGSAGLRVMRLPARRRRRSAPGLPSCRSRGRA